MTLDHALRLLAMLTDTITAQQQQIEALTAEITQLFERMSDNDNT
jgi:uncharacterized coiled-coil protein SlyX